MIYIIVSVTVSTINQFCNQYRSRYFAFTNISRFLNSLSYFRSPLIFFSTYVSLILSLILSAHLFTLFTSHLISSLFISSHLFSSLLISPLHFSSLLLSSIQFASLLLSSFIFFFLLSSHLVSSHLIFPSFYSTSALFKEVSV